MYFQMRFRQCNFMYCAMFLSKTSVLACGRSDFFLMICYLLFMFSNFETRLEVLGICRPKLTIPIV